MQRKNDPSTTTLSRQVWACVEAGRPEDAHDLALDAGGTTSLPLSIANALITELTRVGSWARGLAITEEIDQRVQSPATARRVQDMRAAVALLRDGELELPFLEDLQPFARASNIRALHVLGTQDVGHVGGPGSLTPAEVELERRAGVEPVAVTEMGHEALAGYTQDIVSDVIHRRIPGTARADHRSPAGWLVAHAAKLAKIIGQVRPTVVALHADELASHAGLLVAEAYGLPTVLVADALRGLEGPVAMPSDWAAAYRNRLSGLADVFVPTGELPFGPLTSLLERRGFLPEGTRTIIELRPQPEELERLRVDLGQRARRPLETVFLLSGSQRQASAGDEVSLGGTTTVPLHHPVPWKDLCRDDRSLGYRLNAWEFMEPSLVEYAETGVAEPLNWCIDLAVSWCQEFNEGDGGDTMAWYDMSLAARAPKLAYLLEESIRGAHDERIVSVLYEGVVRHEQELFHPAAYSGHNNHGFYTAIGQLAMARRLPGLAGMPFLIEQGRARLDGVVRTQFAADGGHREHSADYHRMLLDSFVAAVEDGLVDQPDLTSRLSKAQDVMGWFIQPDRSIVQIGDTTARGMSYGWPSTRSPHTAFISSSGELGEPDDRAMLLLPESGYAFVRSPQPRSTDDQLDSCYVSFIGAFHSRAHKHADDLSITWFDAGQEILIDPGKFGYHDLLPKDSPQRLDGFFYGRPERQYVEATRAHCTVEVDGRDHERRRRIPYGSALLGAGQSGGAHWILGEVDHGHWVHRRRLTVRPGQWLWVRDDVHGAGAAEHDFAVWWQVADSWEVVMAGDRAVEFRSTADGSPMWMQSFDASHLDGPVTAQSTPLRGWRSLRDTELVPCWSVACRSRGRRHTFDTLFSLSDDPPTSLPDELQC